ncbi:SRPBCC family protein [Phycisphaeraceae bacterium D3-23]
MKVVKWLAIVVVVLVVAFVVVGLFLPNKIHVERSLAIDAPPEVVFKYLNDLEEWEHWEPFSKGDPSIVTTIGEPSAGVGATQSWVGDSGTGSLTFTMADPDKGIAYDLQFDDFEPSTSEMTYEVVDGKTVLTWTMDGSVGVPVIGGYFAMIIEGMVGPEYEKGLGFLRDVAEADTAGESTDEPDATDESGEPDDSGV